MRDIEINMLEPKKNQFTGFKRAEIIEVAQDFIQQTSTLHDETTRQSRRIVDLVWDLEEEQKSGLHFAQQAETQKVEIDRLRKDIQIAQDTVTEMDKFEYNLSEVLEDAVAASPRLLEFTARMASQLLARGLKAPVKAKTYKAVLHDCRTSRIACIKVLRELTNFQLKEAKDLCDPAYKEPLQSSVLATGLTEKEAETWRKVFRDNAPDAKFTVTLE